MKCSLEFHGAARGVTGSRHLLTVGERRILLDCGMVQGPRRVSERRNRHLGLDPRRIDAVVVSHAHIDHSGSLPRLVRLGYRGPVHCTRATGALLGILLPDSAHIQEFDARAMAKRGKHIEPAYDSDDVRTTLGLVVGEDYERPMEVCPGVYVTFLEAGHILGSAQVLIEIEDGPRIFFTGDLGRPGLPLLRDPAPAQACDVLITESTYGDRVHATDPPMKEALAEVVLSGMERGGRMLVPAFAVGRTQNLLWYLGRLMDEGRLERFPIWVDSPLANKATEVTRQFVELYDAEARDLIHAGRRPLLPPNVQLIEDVEQSKSLNAVRRGMIIAASGMCEGGRVLHHLERTLGRPEDCVLLVGFQAHATLGRRLLEGFPRVKVYGRPHEVRCQVRSIDGMSAHADRDGLLEHLAPLAAHARQTFVVHGEDSAAMRLACALEERGFTQVEVPVRGDHFDLPHPRGSKLLASL